MKKKVTDLKRRAFLKKSLTGLAAIGTVPAAVRAAALGSGRPEKSGLATALRQNDTIVRTLGKTGIKLPVVSMGVMNADNPNVVQAALDSGIFMLDTAFSYQRGRNEEMIGQVIKGRPRDSYVIATKIPASSRRRGEEEQPPDVKIKAFHDNFEISLQRLGLDHVEILYLHNNTSREAALDPAMLEALGEAKKSGKAKFVGLTTHRNEPEVIRAAIESQFYDVVLTAYNFRQDHRDEVRKAIAEAAQAGLGIVAMKTQAGAFWDKEKQDPINMKAALKWVLSDTNVTTAIPGFTTFDQLNEDLEVMTDVKLTEQELKDLRLGEQIAGLYCQQCGRCESDCRQNLPLPSLMRSYMYAYGYKNLEAAHTLLTSLDMPAAPCGTCSSCSSVCAKGFDLREKVMDISRLQALPADFFA